MPGQATKGSSHTAYKAYYLCRLRDLETEIKNSGIRPMTPQEAYQARSLNKGLRMPPFLDHMRPSSSQAMRQSFRKSASDPSLLPRPTTTSRVSTGPDSSQFLNWSFDPGKEGS